MDIDGSAAFLSSAIISGNQTFWASPEAITILSCVSASCLPFPAAYGERTACTGAQCEDAVICCTASHKAVREVSIRLYPTLDEHPILAYRPNDTL